MGIVERVILVTSWVIIFCSIFFIPKIKRREASFAFLFAQFPSWIFGLIVVELGLIEYPQRELRNSNGTSFTFEFLILPVLSIFFNIHYPQSGNMLKKSIYYGSYSGVITAIEVILEKNTELIKYTGWHWYWTYISLVIFFYLIRVAYVWFFKINEQPLS